MYERLATGDPVGGGALEAGLGHHLDDRGHEGVHRLVAGVGLGEGDPQGHHLADFGSEGLALLAEGRMKPSTTAARSFSISWKIGPRKTSRDHGQLAEAHGGRQLRLGLHEGAQVVLEVAADGLAGERVAADHRQGLDQGLGALRGLGEHRRAGAGRLRIRPRGPAAQVGEDPAAAGALVLRQVDQDVLGGVVAAVEGTVRQLGREAIRCMVMPSTPSVASRFWAVGGSVR